jgi:acetoin utilization protein AcuB
MTPTPHTIGADQALVTAHSSMRGHHLRHLPVLRGGRLVGILSQRDLYGVETMRDVDPAQVLVEEAMTSDVYRVDPDETLGRVAATMAARKYGCAVVIEGNEVIGIFTTTDALLALAESEDRAARGTCPSP